MSSFAWMKVLESAPQRYDRGIRLLSGGRIAALYRRLAELATVGDAARSVLDIGCGTGGVTLACADRGACVVGIDRDAGMLEVARGKRVPTGARGRVSWLELDAAEIADRFPPGSFDAVVSCLVFSEMAPEAQLYALQLARSRLRPAGRLIVADEVAPSAPLPRARQRLRRLPLALLAYLLTQTTTRPLRGLPQRVRAAGFVEVEEERCWGGTLSIVVGSVAGTADARRSPAAPSGKGRS